MIIEVANKRYFTNIQDDEYIQKCKKFFSDGCQSYAVSFENNQKDIIKIANIDNMPAAYLRKMNFQKCFLPISASHLDDSIKVLQKGLDLIELL